MEKPLLDNEMLYSAFHCQSYERRNYQLLFWGLKQNNRKIAQIYSQDTSCDSYLKAIWNVCSEW